ncbi:MAG TPA: NUDIX domain-containing protein, partial [Candidatus Eisenbacteria bacterium]
HTAQGNRGLTFAPPGPGGGANVRPRFPCAVCGTPITRRPASATRPRHLTCPRCRYMLYDYPRSAAGLLVVRDARVLLLERAHAPRAGFLDVPGGFVEAGESLEGAARRELEEETGLTLGGVEWLGFYWDSYFIRGFGRFPVMNFYYAARWRRGEPVAADDAASACWIPIVSLGRLRKRFAWTHMTPLFRDLAGWARRH